MRSALRIYDTRIQFLYSKINILMCFPLSVDAALSPNDNIIHPGQKIVPQVMVSIVRSAALAASDIRSVPDIWPTFSVVCI